MRCVSRAIEAPKHIRYCHRRLYRFASAIGDVLRATRLLRRAAVLPSCCDFLCVFVVSLLPYDRVMAAHQEVPSLPATVLRPVVY